jgi:hypothetical protein
MRVRGVVQWGRPCHGRTQRKSEPGSSSRMGMTPTGGPRLSARERRGDRRGARAGRWVGVKAKLAGGLGRAVEGEEKLKGQLC